MIILKKIEARFIEKVIQPGQTEEFFNLNLEDSDAFDWNVKVLHDNFKSITKISSLFNEDVMESTTYAVLGRRFQANINIFVSGEDHCKLEITNNEPSAMKCSVKLKTF